MLRCSAAVDPQIPHELGIVANRKVAYKVVLVKKYPIHHHAASFVVFGTNRL